MFQPFLHNAARTVLFSATGSLFGPSEASKSVCDRCEGIDMNSLCHVMLQAADLTLPYSTLPHLTVPRASTVSRGCYICSAQQMVRAGHANLWSALQWGCCCGKKCNVGHCCCNVTQPPPYSTAFFLFFVFETGDRVFPST